MEKVVVLIDDDLDDIEFLKESIQIVNPAVLCMHFSNSAEAVQKISSGEFPLSPDYIFIDFNMPMLNGEVCLKMLKELKILRKTKFILNSTSMSDSLADKLKSEGADITFQKPCEFESYQQVLQAIPGLKASSEVRTLEVQATGRFTSYAGI